MARLIPVLAASLLATAAAAQDMPGMDHSTMDHSTMDHSAANQPATGDAAMPAMAHDMAGMTMDGMTMDLREASGTSWQPASSPMDAVHFSAGDWSMMAHGFITGIYDNQGGGRGGTKAFSESMGMLMGTRPVGDGGTFGLRGMFSLDPLMGKRGYPLLLATGETADGVTSLVDRQHPHDLLMELAATYSQSLGGGKAVSLYAAYPGEPALGPPTFMHRTSGIDNPEAPIGHHWFDSTHITFGVVTAGYSTTHWRLEGSLFKGQEPDQYRYGWDKPKLDSWSVRATWNPTDNVSMQASTGHLKSPEQLHPDRDEQRTTVSASYNRPLPDGGNWATTFVASIKNLSPGPALKAYLLESSWRIDRRNTFFARAEHKQDDELFENEPASPLHEQVIAVTKLSVGYVRTLPVSKRVKLDLGGLASAYAWPDGLDAAYGKPGVKSFMLFVRLKLAE